MAAPAPDIAFLGFGEAASAFLTGLRQEAETSEITAWGYDTKTDIPAIAQDKLDDFERLNVCARVTPADLSRAPILFSLVTADQAHEAAKSVAAVGELSGQFFFDGNSCAPQSKTASAALINGAGGRYIDMAVMAPVHPHLHQTACLISGEHVAEAADTLSALGMNVTPINGPVGAASMRKMVRSVMIKGIEALTLECLIAARKAGIDDETLASLAQTYPGIDWPNRAPYNIERATTHGVRRAAEMREVAKTVEGLDLPADMSHAIVKWQQRVGDLGLPPGDPNLPDRADAVLDALAQIKE